MWVNIIPLSFGTVELHCRIFREIGSQNLNAHLARPNSDGVGTDRSKLRGGLRRWGRASRFWIERRRGPSGFLRRCFGCAQARHTLGFPLQRYGLGCPQPVCQVHRESGHDQEVDKKSDRLPQRHPPEVLSQRSLLSAVLFAVRPLDVGARESRQYRECGKSAERARENSAANHIPGQNRSCTQMIRVYFIWSLLQPCRDNSNANYTKYTPKITGVRP